MASKLFGLLSGRHLNWSHTSSPASSARQSFKYAGAVPSSHQPHGACPGEHVPCKAVRPCSCAASPWCSSAAQLAAPRGDVTWQQWLIGCGTRRVACDVCARRAAAHACGGTARMALHARIGKATRAGGASGPPAARQRPAAPQRVACMRRVRGGGRRRSRRIPGLAQRRERRQRLDGSAAQPLCAHCCGAPSARLP